MSPRSQAEGPAPPPGGLRNPPPRPTCCSRLLSTPLSLSQHRVCPRPRTGLSGVPYADAARSHTRGASCAPEGPCALRVGSPPCPQNCDCGPSGSPSAGVCCWPPPQTGASARVHTVLQPGGPRPASESLSTLGETQATEALATVPAPFWYFYQLPRILPGINKMTLGPSSRKVITFTPSPVRPISNNSPLL